MRRGWFLYRGDRSRSPGILFWDFVPSWIFVRRTTVCFVPEQCPGRARKYVAALITLKGNTAGVVSVKRRWKWCVLNENSDRRTMERFYLVLEVENKVRSRYVSWPLSNSNHVSSVVSFFSLAFCSLSLSLWNIIFSSSPFFFFSPFPSPLFSKRWIKHLKNGREKLRFPRPSSFNSYENDDQRNTEALLFIPREQISRRYQSVRFKQTDSPCSWLLRVFLFSRRIRFPLYGGLIKGPGAQRGTADDRCLASWSARQSETRDL